MPQRLTDERLASIKDNHKRNRQTYDMYRVAPDTQVTLARVSALLDHIDALTEERAATLAIARDAADQPTDYDEDTEAEMVRDLIPTEGDRP